MKTLIILLTCILALTAGSIEAKDWKEVRIAIDVPFEPFIFWAPDGSLTGFEVELGNAVCTEIKAKGKWISQAWDGMIPSLLARKYDAVMSSMAITEQRAKKGMSLDFS
jgi:arginine/ornithine transport system substrate-binding protein